MRIALVALAWLLFATSAFAENVVGPSNVILCNKVGVLEAGTSGSQTVIAGIAGQTISICGWNVTNSGTTGTTAITTGTTTTTPCDTGTRKMSPAFSVSSTSPNQTQTQYATQSAPQGASVCANPSATTFTVLIWYSQQ